MDHNMGPVFPIALNTKATISTPPVNPGEKDIPSPNDIFSLPNNTPNTIPMAMGKKSVSDNNLALLPNMQAKPLNPSFSPTTISLSPNFRAKSGEGERSIPLRLTRVTVQPKFWCKFKSPSCLLIIFLLVNSKDWIS